MVRATTVANSDMNQVLSIKGHRVTGEIGGPGARLYSKRARIIHCCHPSLNKNCYLHT